jgi:hypothetical protein
MKDGYLHVKFSPKGGYLVSSGGIDNNFHTTIWDMKDFKQIYQFESLFSATTSNIDISNDSMNLSFGRSYFLFLINSHWSIVVINELPNQTTQIIYPNPAGNQITVPIETGLVPISIKLSDLSGQILKSITQFPSGLNEINIDISNFPSGVYFATVIYQSKSLSYKIEKL